MRVLHISDIHYRKQHSDKNKYELMLKSMDPTLPRLQVLISNIEDIDCIVITGDLCDDGTEEDYKELKEYLDSLSIPYVVCLGNHDDKLAFYKGWFNKETDDPFLGVQMIQGIPFIYFDNSKYGNPNGYVDEDRVLWLKETLQQYPHSVVLMHHQFEDLPGIPGLEKGEVVKELLLQADPLAILTGHTHWYLQEYLETIPYCTAPSVSFRGLNKEDGSVEFTQAQGYCVYEITKDTFRFIKVNVQQEKHLATWEA